MPKKGNFPDKDLIVLSFPSSVVANGNARNIIPSRNFIFSKKKFKSHQIILEGIAYE